MKIGIRKPSIKKSISAKTVGRATRTIKKGIDPTYGVKGVGIIKNPKKAMYNKVYNKTTIGINDIGKISQTTSKSNKHASSSYYNTEQPLINRINKLKKLRFWFNLIGYFFIIPTVFNIIVKPRYFINSIILEPEILPIILIISSPFIFIIYKSHTLKKELIILNNEFDSLKTETSSLIEDIDELLNNKQSIDIIYETINRDELIERILKSNSEIIEILNNIISSIIKYNFEAIEIYKESLIMNLRDIIKSSDILLSQNNIDGLSKIYIESIVNNANSLNFNTKQLIISIELLRLDYEFNGTIDSKLFINNANSLIYSCKEINENANYFVNKSDE